MFKLVDADHLGAFYVDGYGLIPKEELTENHLANMYTGGCQYVVKTDKHPVPPKKETAKIES